MEHVFDVLIVGGGMTGATLACALGNTSLSVAVVEYQEPEPFHPEQPHDLRVSALSIASQNILEMVGAWSGITGRRACPYRRLKTWEANAVHAATEFNAAESHYSHLGYITENRVIQLALLERLQAFDNVTLICPAQTERLDYSSSGTRLYLKEGQVISAPLVVAADGGESRVRQAAGIGVHQWDYEQHALVASVVTDYPQQDITWQQFTPTGPLAFLPLNGHHASLVWYHTPADVKRLMQASDDDFIAELTATFPEDLGQINQLLGRASFPLRRQHARHYVAPGVALIGDAAHMIHPLAGQGVNIGLLDAAALAETLIRATRKGQDIAAQSTLAQYEKSRRKHNLLMMQVMDSFYRVFSNEIGPLRLVRNMGLSLAGHLPPARKKVMRFAMGLEGPVPALARKEPI